MEKERQDIIEKQNKNHYAKLHAIRESHGRLDNWNNYPHRSLNLGSRLQSLEQVTLENDKMLARILSRESEYRKWESEWEKVEQLRARISRYPRISGPSWVRDSDWAFRSTLTNISERTSLGSTKVSSFVSDKKRRVLASANAEKSRKSSILSSSEYDTDRESTYYLNKTIKMNKAERGIQLEGQKRTLRSPNNFKNTGDNYSSEDNHVTFVTDRRLILSQESSRRTDLYDESTEGAIMSEGQHKQETALSWKNTKRATSLSDQSSNFPFLDEASDQDSHFSLVESDETSHSLQTSQESLLSPKESKDSEGSSLSLKESQHPQGHILLPNESGDSEGNALSLKESTDSQGSFVSPTESPRFSESMSRSSQNAYKRATRSNILSPEDKNTLEMSLKGGVGGILPSSEGTNNLVNSSQESFLSQAYNKPDTSLEADRHSEASSKGTNPNMNPSLRAFSRSSLSSFEY
ncbi:Hypothetical predicted protein [Pelobates cultripes]|uniref:Uncharacterized protein n=1 Tax=Pelobates cultripes TaxID=61616 RepID=A0AAD1RKK7_PELCU|nr:Hypothetical predicted protein [Pelobates cultripes]